MYSRFMPEGFPSGIIFFGGTIMINHEKTKKLTVLEMLGALAYVAVVVGHIPAVVSYCVSIQ